MCWSVALSEIFGSLSANGRIFLINPLGVLFAPGASVDVGGLMASTLDIKNSDFLAGHYVFADSGNGSAAISNAGILNARNGGFIVLAGDSVSNSGIIQAQLGQVVLASGSAVTLDLAGNGLVSFAVDRATLAAHAGVSNAGQIFADGGRVLMTAATARELVGTAVNNSGLVRARSIAEHDGKIELIASGGDLVDSGVLDASASQAGGHGGSVSLSADRNIALTQAARIDADGGAHGVGGTVRVIADGDATIEQTASISAQGGASGGFAEFSGHGALHLRGAVQLGAGGTLLLDPTDLIIADGNGSTDSSATVYEQQIEAQLNSGTSVQLVASNSITLDSLSDGTLDGSNSAHNGGALTLAIGTVDGGLIRFDSGSISFSNTANTIKVDGDLTIDGGTSSGTLTLGRLIGREQDHLILRKTCIPHERICDQTRVVV